MSIDKRIFNKLEILIYKIECLGIQLDKPTSHMTLGEYEDKCKEIIESCVKSIEEMLGAGTCYPVPIYSFNGEFTEYDCDACSECGTEWDGDMPNFCPNCGRRVIEVDE